MNVAQSLLALLHSGPRSTPELAQSLGSSEPTVLRALRALERDQRVLRMGKTKGARYALRRNVGAIGSRWPLFRIDEKGLVTASYSDGSTIALGKIAVANFNNPSGLHQVGNTTWTASGTSGDPEIGEAGSDGRGTISSGELEMSNVDLTTELVNLISAQRDFQANAKAIDTDKQMISSILNMQ